jgi:hypothetical protein
MSAFHPKQTLAIRSVSPAGSKRPGLEPISIDLLLAGTLGLRIAGWTRMAGC